MSRTRLQYGDDQRFRPSVQCLWEAQCLRGRSTVENMIGFIVLLLVIWLVLAILGFVIKGLFWLAIIGIVLFVVTGIVGYLRRGGSRS